MEKLNIGGAEQVDARRNTAENHEGWVARRYSAWAENHPDLADRLGNMVLKATGTQALMDAFDRELNYAVKAIRGRVE